MCGGGNRDRRVERMYYEEYPGETPVAPATKPCPQCGYAVQDDFILCPLCGTQLKTSCPECHRAVDVTWSRCPYCGTALETAVPYHDH